MIPNSRKMPSLRIFVALGLSIFMFVSFLLYAYVDSNAKIRQDVYSNSQSDSIAQLKQKIETLERQLNKNDEIISRLDQRLINEGARQLDANHQIPPDEANQEGVGVVRRPSTQASGSQCSSRSAKSDVQMLDAYMQLPFDNPDGGVWKQGFDIKYDKQKIRQEKKLEVIVVPHSHMDPGWLKTFEEYYDTQSRKILTGMLQYLEAKPDIKFICAEMSFFELWWSRLTETERDKTKSLLGRGQLEIVTGGWVMTDEANAHTFSIVMELIEGHEFLRNQLDYRPRSHWSIDPFGLSATLAKLIKASNLTHMAIQRVHYSVKKFLAETKQLEFQWRQLYAGNDRTTDIRTHMFPFYSYDVPHTCGPDPSICCQFDFRRLASIGCPWGKRPQRITDRNVAARAEMLADQYRKKAQLYRMNTLLVPLGDDFRYDSSTEWEDQYENYRQLFNYMNSKQELNINARFGTLGDYFDLLDKRLAEEPNEPGLPVLSGDFFTYADRDDHYWSGYFTSRPFYKHMDRTLQHYLRSADILHSLTVWKSTAAGSTELSFPVDYYDRLVESRRSLSLFQHHDGITGTARDHVVIDYGKKMLDAINNCSQIIIAASAYLLGIQNSKDGILRSDLEFFLDELPEQMKIEEESSIILHNSLGYERHSVVCLRVTSPKSRIQKEGKDPRQQIQPLIKLEQGGFVVAEDEYELCFEAIAPALGFERYSLVEGADSEHMVKGVEFVHYSLVCRMFDDHVELTSSDVVSLSNSRLTANFDPLTGYLKSIRRAKEKEIDLRLEFLHYGVRQKKAHSSGSDSLSGAYLFLPDGEAQPLSTQGNSFVVFKGDVRQSILLKGPSDASVYQHVYLDFNSPALDIVTRVDVRATSNFELSMRIKSDDLNSSDDQFYTDLNGFQMIRRKRFDKLPRQAHFYPMTSAGFIDSNGRRLSLLSRQALGVASLVPGQIEVILDRRLLQDDDRGLVQGVTDNKQTESHFRLHLESVRQKNAESNRAGFLSTAAFQSLRSLNYPLITFHGHIDSSVISTIPRKVSFLKKPLPCDTHLFALRIASEPTVYSSNGTRHTKPKPEASLILERQGTECSIDGGKLEGCSESDGKFQLHDYFTLGAKYAKSTSLTGMYEENGLLAELQMNPMDLKAIKVEF